MMIDQSENCKERKYKKASLRWRKRRKSGSKRKSAEEMSAGSTISKKIKEEAVEEEETANGEDDNSIAEQEEALVALIEHRTKEVEHLGQRISYYKSQVHPFPLFS